MRIKAQVKKLPLVVTVELAARACRNRGKGGCGPLCGDVWQEVGRRGKRVVFRRCYVHGHGYYPNARKLLRDVRRVYRGISDVGVKSSIKGVLSGLKVAA